MIRILKSFSDLKTETDFDMWYGRKPEWKTCQHQMVSLPRLKGDVCNQARCTKCLMLKRI